MRLKETLLSDMKKAMKSRDKSRLSTLRLLLAAVKNREIEQRKEIDDPGVMVLIGSMIQQHRQAIELYRKGGRQDLVDKEEREIEVLQGYLPPPLTPEELERIVKGAIGKTGATTKKDIGRVMKEIMPQVRGRADGKEVNALVVRHLENRLSS